MSKIINFNAKDFHFDASCENNVGSRMIQHNHLGQNETIFEIGDWRWNWTQIISSQHLEKNTDYLFRFAIELGINDTDDAVSQLYIIRDKNYEDRDVYPLQQSRFLPVLSKDGPNGLLRVFEIPFNSGEAEITDLVFVAQHAVTRILPAHELKEYDSLKDLSYNEWWEKRSSEIPEDDDFHESGNSAGWAHIENIAQSAIKIAHDNVKAQYDAAPNDSIQKTALKSALEQLEAMLSGPDAKESKH